MDLRKRVASALRSVVPRTLSTRELLRERRLVSASIRQGSAEGSRPIDDRARLAPLAEALRDAARIGRFATLYLAPPSLPLTLRFEGGAARSIRVGRPADRLRSTAFLAEIDGSAYIATGRQLGFLFAVPDQAADASPGTASAGPSASAPAFSTPAQSAAGAWPWTSAASEA